jgi:hypothetical protein
VTEATLARNPCIHAGSENPVVRYNAAFGRQKSMEKPRFPQFSWGFVQFLPEFADYLRVLPVLAGFDGVVRR